MERNIYKNDFIIRLKNLLISLGYKESFDGNCFSKIINDKCLLSYFIRNRIYDSKDFKIYLNFSDNFDFDIDKQLLDYAFFQMCQDLSIIRRFFSDN